MNKKRTAILAVALFFCLAALCGILFTGRQKEKPEEKTPAYEDEKKQGEDGDARQYKFENLENIYYLPDDKEEFEKEAGEFLRENGIEPGKVNALGKYKDDPGNMKGPAEFYLQADDGKNSVIKAVYDKEKGKFSFSMYDGVIENIEDYGGIPAKNKAKQEAEPEYSAEGLEEIDFGMPVVTDNEGQLAEVETDLEGLAKQLRDFLAGSGEERRFMSVLHAAASRNGYEAALIFENPRADGKYISVTYDGESAAYHIEFQE